MAKNKKDNGLEKELTQTEYAKLASRHVNGDFNLVIGGMQKFYSQFEGLEDDPLIQSAIYDAAEKQKAGNLTKEHGLMQAITHYTLRHDMALLDGTVKDFISYSGYTLPEDARLIIDKHMDRNYGEFVEAISKNQKKDKEKRDIELANIGYAFNLIEGYKYDLSLGNDLEKEMVDDTMEAIFKKKKTK